MHMLSKLRKSNEKGFTLIELMIVIAIIGILAAIAIPNFISYRNKSYCSAAESDANAVASALADYYAIPTNTGMPTSHTDLGLTLSNGNGAVIAGDPNGTMTITVNDSSGRCPADYRASNPEWASGSFVKTLASN
jgi:prepilin-type N-terminal cleavage/methylation domain-containing protein